MATWFRVTARTIAFRFPIILGSIRIILNKAQKIREFKNVNSLLLELHSDTALQLPILVEQNRKMFRELELLKLEVKRMKEEMNEKNM
jgi:hypothetical protein